MMFKLKPYLIKDNQPKNHHNTHFVLALFGLFILTIAMFGDVLFTSKDIVLSNQTCDIHNQFIYWRDFGFGELRNGNIALWNPYIFCGIPYLGGSQSALLYPLNLLYLFLPLSKAINFSIALHIFLAGIFMYLWTLHYKLHPLACFLSSVLLMFCGAHFLHIYAGHLPNLCTMIWVPLVFLSIDRLFKNYSFDKCFLGIFAVTMQILAGHPQYLFYTAVAVLLYSGLRIIKAKHRIKILSGIFIIYIGAFALGAVQILTSIQAAGESIRINGLSYNFASLFSFPPENFLTFLVPNFFGDNISLLYWGRCYLWEMSLFISVTGLILTIFGIIYGKQNIRYISITIIAMLFILALGSHTPLFRFLYQWIPGFNMFRGSSKFIFFASLFIILQAGIGLNYIIRSQSIPRKMIILTVMGSLLFGVTALCLRYSIIKNPQALWQHIMYAVYNMGESYLPVEIYTNATFIQQAGFLASKGIIITAGTLLLISIVLSMRKFNKIPYVIVLIAIIEIFIFAKASRATFHLSSTKSAEMKTFKDNYPGDYRILYFNNPNSTMSLQMHNIDGYDPGVLKRYAEFITFTQGRNPDTANQFLGFHHFHPLIKMLRCRYIFFHYENKMHYIDNGSTLPLLLLINNWALIPGRDQIFVAMNDADFNPREKVILQSMPYPKPSKSLKEGTTKILNYSTDHLTIETNLTHPAILLITNLYSKEWHARSLVGSTQEKYNIMPANYILQAIPLSKGHHHIRVEYLPLAFQIGKWISLISIIIYFGLLGWNYRNNRSRF